MSTYRSIIPVILLLAISSLFAHASGVNRPKPDISLTLIPPSPVTDQITLDVRAGIWNHTGAQKTVNVSFYLDKEAKGSLLHQQNIVVAAHANGLMKFP
ncbi:MAG: hypothetical protein EOP51_22215, partial [Sphingobacteriales bacterium]